MDYFGAMALAPTQMPNPLPHALFLLRKYPPIHTGDGLLVRILARHLARKGHPVTVVCTAPKEGPVRDPGIRLVTLPAGRPMSLTRIGIHSLALGEALRHPGGALLTLGGDPLLLPVMAAVKARGGSLFHRTSLMGSDDAFTLSRRRGGRAVLRALALWRGQILCVSDDFRPGFVTSGIPESRIHSLPPCIDTDRYLPATPQEKFSLRQKLGLSGNPLWCFLGGVIHRKGIDLLLQAWPQVIRAHPRSHLLLVGPHDPLSSFGASLEKGLATANLSATVTFAGQKSDPSPYLRAADAFVFPSRQEGFGMALAEAMCVGVPAVTTRFTGLTEALGRPGEEFLMTELNPESLAAGMLAIMKDPALAHRLASHGRPWIEERFSVSALGDRLSDLVRRGGDRG